MVSIAVPDGGHAEVLWRNGELVPWHEATTHVRAVGHASVSAVLEGVRAYWSPAAQRLHVFRLAEHLDRLVASARLSRLQMAWTSAELAEAVLAVLRANRYRADTYIRPWVFIAGLVSEMIAPADAPTETVIDTWPSPPARTGGARVVTSSWRRISDQQMSPRIKAFANYHQARLALAEARLAGYDLPLFLNDRGHVSEGTGACVAMVRGGRLVIPPLSAGVLESITRATVLTLAADHLAIPTAERDIDRAELALADEAFFLGTGWELLPITEVDGLAIGTGEPGPVAAELTAAYQRAVRGEIPDYAHWLTPVPGAD
ncbi:aminotransferase class IV [Actinokineospora sp. NPDC004072]